MSAYTDALERARRDVRIERRAAERHLATCRWCADRPCPMGRAVVANAEAHERHLAGMEVAR